MFSRNVVLLGHMYSGKKSIGKKVAQIMGLSFICLEQAIKQKTGVTIDWIRDIESEEGVQERGLSILEELVKDPGVISVCNAVKIFPSFREKVLKNSVVVYIGTDRERLIDYCDKRFNSLADTIEDINSFFSLYEKQYKSFADIKIDPYTTATRDAVKTLAQHIEEGILYENK